MVVVINNIATRLPSLGKLRCYLGDNQRVPTDRYYDQVKWKHTQFFLNNKSIVTTLISLWLSLSCIYLPLGWSDSQSVRLSKKAANQAKRLNSSFFLLTWLRATACTVSGDVSACHNYTIICCNCRCTTYVDADLVKRPWLSSSWCIDRFVFLQYYHRLCRNGSANISEAQEER